jgi:lysophospholipase L1-like esterase
MLRFHGVSVVLSLSCGVLWACGDGASGQGAPPAGTAGAAPLGTAGAAAGAAPLGTAGAAAGGIVNGSAGTGAVFGGAGSGGASGGTGTAGAVSAGGTLAGGGGVSAGAGAGGSPSSGAGGEPTVCTSAAKPTTIYMIGDSTMSVYASTLAPRMGWGQPFGTYFNASCATVVDKALSGRSSKSFFDEGAWTPVKNALQSGDYVLIQFGHNDEKNAEPTLFTDPQTTYKQFLTTYISDTRAKMATPILLTSINRNNWSTGTTVKDTHGAYPPAVRELAAALEVDLIDLTALTKSYFERIGQAETAKLFLILAAGESPNYPNGVTDNAHLQEKGALTIGQLAMADAWSQKLSIASLLKAVAVAP